VRDKDKEFAVICDLGERSKEVLLAGGSIMHTKSR
jgi:hypothetical protein